MSNEFPLPGHLLPADDASCNAVLDDTELEQQLGSDATLAAIEALEAKYMHITASAAPAAASAVATLLPDLTDADLCLIDQLEAAAFGGGSASPGNQVPPLAPTTTEHENNPTDAQIESVIAENSHLFL